MFRFLSNNVSYKIFEKYKREDVTQTIAALLHKQRNLKSTWNTKQIPLMKQPVVDRGDGMGL